MCAECVQAAAAKADASGRRDSELRVMLCVRTDLGMKVAVQGLWFMVYVLCFIFYVLCFLFYVLHFNLHVASLNLQCHAPTHLISINSCPQPGKVAAQCGHAVLGM